MALTPDPGWIPFLKILFGFMLLVILAALAAAIALGSVEQKSSFGLDIILGGLIGFAGGFVHWCFSAPSDGGK